MRWFVLIFLAACSASATEDHCDWNWIEEEHCLMDTCDLQLQAHERDHSWTECHHGECWCCADPQYVQGGQAQCWYSGVVLKPWSDGDS